MPHEFTFLSETDYKKWTKRITPIENDIVFSYEATLDRYAIIPKGFYGCLGRRLAIIRVKSNKVNIKWLHYYFKSPEWKTFIANRIINGSTVNRISINDFPFYPISLPKRAIQDNIVMILENIDRKIRLNNAINAELEKIAKTLYNYWFVQFDFPNAKGKPYRTSGGKMEYNEVLKREIPKGWNIQKLNKTSLCSLMNSGIDYFDGEKIYLSTSEVDGTEIVNHTVTTNYPNRLSRANMQPQLNSVWFAKMKDTIKNILVNDGSEILVTNYIFSTGFAGLQCHKNTLYYVWNYLRGDYFEKKKNLLATGATQQAINDDDIKGFDIIVPSEQLLQSFHNIVSPYYHLISKAKFENKELTELRDFLLPLLMNGQVRVREESTHREKPTIGKRLTQQQTFMRLVLAAYILDTICDEPTAGRVKFEKLLFLCLYCAQIAVKSKFHRHDYGPYDSKALFSIEKQLKDNKWFKKNTVKKQYRAYVRLGKSCNYKQYVETNFNPLQKKVIDKILRLFRTLTTERCEIVATLYGAWNDFLIDGVQPTDEQIVDEVLTNWHERKKHIDRHRWLKALEWMREKDIIPVGFGTSTRN